jgi:hypothetical protein
MARRDATADANTWDRCGNSVGGSSLSFFANPAEDCRRPIYYLQRRLAKLTAQRPLGFTHFEIEPQAALVRGRQTDVVTHTLAIIWQHPAWQLNGRAWASEYPNPLMGLLAKRKETARDRKGSASKRPKMVFGQRSCSQGVEFSATSDMLATSVGRV